MARSFSVITALVVFALAANAQPLPEALRGEVLQVAEVTQADAELLFASAEAAIWFPDLREVRVWNVTNDRREPRSATLADFNDAIEREFPGYRSDRHGPWLMKMPQRVKPLPDEGPGETASDATLLSDSFEGPTLPQWTLANNANGDYNFVGMGCKANGGSWSADAVRGGTRGMHLTCWDSYPAGVTTQITHNACDGISGASQAWLDFYFTAEMDASEAFGVYYIHSDGYIYGYGFTGSWTGWYHVILNLRQWNTLGDLTALTCPKVLFQFRSDATAASGAGLFLDDVTIRNDAPSFLRASIAATPSSGTAPLTVSFVPTVSGASGAESYEWRFGDAASSSSTSKNAMFTYTTAGEYWARFRVSDATSSRAYAHAKIVVTAGSGCSVSCTASAPASLAAGAAGSFQATATPSGCSGSPSYLWNFGDGQTSTQQNASHAYSTAGTYSWTMTATVSGTSCSKSGTVTVTAGSGKTAKRRSVVRPSDPVVASQPIGPSGGTVSGGGLSITVPAGAFGSSSTVAVTKSTSLPSGGELSSTYYVEGIPSSLGADVALSIDLDATPSVATGESVYVSFTGAGMTRDLNVKSVPFFIPATVSGRNVKATLPKSSGSAMFSSRPAGPIESQAYTGDFRREVKVVKATTLSNDHFTISFASSYADWARTTLSILEQAYQRLAALGFNWGCRQGGTFAKIPVYMRSLGTGETDPYGQQISRLDPCGTGWVFTDYIEVNTDYSPNTDAMRAALAHELMHELQETYVPTTLTNPSRGLWMAEAAATWFETIFVSGSCPGVMTGSYQFPWRGLFNSTGSAVEGTGRRQIQNHGYGAAALLKYHSDQSSVQNDSFVSSIYASMKNGSSELEALQNAVGSSLGAYWLQFAKDYYSGVAGCSTYLNAVKRATMKDAPSLMQTYKFGAYPMSSQSYLFDVQKLEITDKTPLPIIAQGLIDGQTVYVYDIKSKKELAQLTKASPNYEISDITAYKGSILVITFVDANLPAGTSSTNEVTITTGSTYKCYAQAKVAWYRTANTICTAGCTIYDGSISSLFIGNVNGDKFHSEEMWCAALPSWCRWREDNATYTSRVDFTFTNKGAQIENFDLSTSLTTKYGGPSIETVKVSVPVPLLARDATRFDYKLTGQSVCSSVSSSNPATIERTCDAGSYFLLTCEAYTPPAK